MAARFQSGDDLAETHEINVTPFIDVILVLLIIFMIAAPLSTVDVAVDLPTSNAEARPPPEKPVTLTLKSDRTLVLENQPLAREALGNALDQALQSDKQRRIFLRADKSVPYGDLMALMNDLRTDGYLKIGLVGIESDRQP
jgi:TonB system transport protein ExbD (group 1)